MSRIVIDAAYITFVVQLYLFVIPAAVSIWYLIREVFVLKPLPEERKAGGSRRNSADLPDLEPLNCPSCGAGVPLDIFSMKCRHCGTEFPVPPEYEEIRIARSETAVDLHRAERYWRVASVLSSNWVLSATLIASLWLIACLIVIFSINNTDELLRFKEVAYSYAIPITTQIIWIATLLFIGISITLKVRSALPEIKNIDAAALEGNAQCRDCGGAIYFRAGDLAALCGYCGVSTYRVSVAVKAAVDADTTAKESSAILVEQMSLFRDSIEEYLSVPILVIAVPTVLAILAWLLFVGTGVLFSAFVWIIAYIIVNLVTHPLLTLSVLTALAALFFFRRSITQLIRRSSRSKDQ